jgi:hypothetical protein
MTPDTWAKIARRQARYRELLLLRMESLSQDICRSFDLQELLATRRAWDRIAERSERHEERIQRHIDTAMRRILPGGCA